MMNACHNKSIADCFTIGHNDFLLSNILLFLHPLQGNMSLFGHNMKFSAK